MFGCVTVGQFPMLINCGKITCSITGAMTESGCFFEMEQHLINVAMWHANLLISVICYL